MRNLDNDIASICGVRGLSTLVRDEAWRLASSTPNPNPGAAGWRRRWAEQLVERATEMVATAKAERAEREAIERAEREARWHAEARAAKRDAEARAAEERAALIAAGEAAGGFGLRDTNTYYYNCGHYPHYEVVAGGDYKTIEAAEAAAARKNSASSAEWQQFLNPRG